MVPASTRSRHHPRHIVGSKDGTICVDEEDHDDGDAAQSRHS